jgi:hypothetical protein
VRINLSSDDLIWKLDACKPNEQELSKSEMCALQSNEFGMDLDVVTQRYNSAVSSFHEWHQGVVIIIQISCVHRVVPRWRLDMFLAISGVVGLLCCDPKQHCHMQCCKSILVAAAGKKEMQIDCHQGGISPARALSATGVPCSCFCSWCRS